MSPTERPCLTCDLGHTVIIQNTEYNTILTCPQPCTSAIRVLPTDKLYPIGLMDSRRKSLASASLGAYGGKFIARGGATESLEGDWAPERIVLLEFPSLARAKQWWASPEYSDAKAIRMRAAQTRMIATEGV